MRIVCWNINGIRTLPQYHPWNTYKTGEAILDAIGGDITCFQEMKSSRQAIGRNFALPDKYATFLSFPSGKGKGGYSGVSVYTKVTPRKAEEGLTGLLQPKPPLDSSERISNVYPHAHEMTLMADEEGNFPLTLDALDAEGRGLVVDFGLFVLINVYCPNLTSEERMAFKMNYHYLLQERVRQLIEVDHREVIVVGDINVTATPDDHCDGHLPSNEATFWDEPHRKWFREWLYPRGPMHDVIRSFWPDRKAMYTCWNQKIGARATNYGTRIDYVLVTKGLLPWVKHGDIQPSIKGSDHCPIYIDLHEEMELDGRKFSLRERMFGSDPPKQPPRMATQYWDEYSGKQTMLSSFFGKKGTQPPTTQKLNAVTKASSAFSLDLDTEIEEILPPSSSQVTRTSSPPPESDSQPTRPLKRKESPSQPASQIPRPSSPITAKPIKKQKIGTKSGQTKLSSFFAAPSKHLAVGTVSQSETVQSNLEEPLLILTQQSSAFSQSDDPEQPESDSQLSCSLDSSSQTTQTSISNRSGSSSQPKSSKSTAASWSTIMAPLVAPLCTVHREPTKELTVNKPGPNKGKKFYVCSRPVGPGYDRGKTERLREEVNPQYKCNFFKWASDIRKESMRVSTSRSQSRSQPER